VNFAEYINDFDAEAITEGADVILFPTSAEEWAVRWAKRGLAVFPVSTRGHYCPKRKDEKGDEIDGTGGFRRASTDPETVRALYAECREVYGYDFDGIGWAIPEGVVALDLDEKPTPGGIERHGLKDWENLTDDFGRIAPETQTQKTKSGGRHILFRIPAGLSLDQAGFQRTCPGIDLKGNDQGLIKIEGMPGYKFEGGFSLDRIANCPDWLLPMITRKAKPREKAQSVAVKVGDIVLRGHMSEWINRAVAKQKANPSGARNPVAVWAAQQMRDSMSADGYDYRENLPPFLETLREKLSDLKPEPYTVEQMDKVFSGLGEPRPAAANVNASQIAGASSWRSPSQVLRHSAANAEKWETGFATLDALTKGGIRAGDLCIIKGHTEAGKTSLAVQIAQQWAKRDDVLIVGVFDDEGAAAAAVRLGQGMFEIDRDKLEARDERALKTLDALDDKIFLPDHDSPDADTLEKIEAEALQRANGRNVVLILDSAQTLKTEGVEESERLQIKSVVNRAGKMAKKYGWRVVLLSEVNRGGYSDRDAKKRVSKLADGSGSSRIEYGCELLIDIETASRVQVLKNRIGSKKGGFVVEFDTERALFCEIEASVAQKREDDARKLDEKVKLDDTAKKILDALRESPGSTARDLQGIVGGASRTFTRAWAKLKSQGRVTATKREGRGGGELWHVAA
jgi:KaiC/GvpD/RAD55 family RecA-like ATPase